MNLTDCTVSSNTAKYSAGLNSLGPITLTDCTISGNTATGGGGGVGVGPGAATLTNCTISGNSAAYGGGLLNYAQAILTDCTISGNTAPTGAGIANQSAIGLHHHGDADRYHRRRQHDPRPRPSLAILAGPTRPASPARIT